MKLYIELWILIVVVACYVRSHEVYNETISDIEVTATDSSSNDADVTSGNESSPTEEETTDDSSPSTVEVAPNTSDVTTVNVSSDDGTSRSEPTSDLEAWNATDTEENVTNSATSPDNATHLTSDFDEGVNASTAEAVGETGLFQNETSSDVSMETTNLPPTTVTLGETDPVQNETSSVSMETTNLPPTTGTVGETDPVQINDTSLTTTNKWVDSSSVTPEYFIVTASPPLPLDDEYELKKRFNLVMPAKRWVTLLSLKITAAVMFVMVVAMGATFLTMHLLHGRKRRRLYDQLRLLP